MNAPVHITYTGRICRVSCVLSDRAYVTYFAVGKEAVTTKPWHVVTDRIRNRDRGPVVFIGGLSTTELSYIEDNHGAPRYGAEISDEVSTAVGSVPVDVDEDEEDGDEEADAERDHPDIAAATPTDRPWLDDDVDTDEDHFQMLSRPPESIVAVLEDEGYTYEGIDGVRVQDNTHATEQVCLDSVFETIPPRLVCNESYVPLLAVKTDWDPVPADAPVVVDPETPTTDDDLSETESLLGSLLG